MRFTREVFASHPDKVIAVKVTASQPGALNFTLRPQIPHLTSNREGDTTRAKTGKVTAAGDTITLAGAMAYYDVRYEGQLKVIPTGGTLTATNPTSGGRIAVANADSAVILIAGGTNYQMVPQVFSATDRLKKLEGLPLRTRR